MLCAPAAVQLNLADAIDLNGSSICWNFPVRHPLQLRIVFAQKQLHLVLVLGWLRRRFEQHIHYIANILFIGDAFHGFRGEGHLGLEKSGHLFK